MRFLLVREGIAYDGSQLSSLWAFREFGVQGDSIVAFRGPCTVKREALVDLADYRAGSFIYSPDMLHFIAEHFENDLEKAVLRQRLLAVIIKEALEEGLDCKVTRRGDDLFAGEEKLSVSIATATPVSVMIHFGLNIDATGAPVPAAGLLSLGWPEGGIFPLAERVLAAYAEETAEVRLARCKVRGVP